MTFDLDDQRQAILAHDGHVMVTGGPGCGKTTVALFKAKGFSRDLLPGQQILFLSFSRAAVRQIISRCSTVLNRTERKCIQVKTYHSFCLELLESHGRLLTGKPIHVIYPGAERLLKSRFKGDWEQRRAQLREQGELCFDFFACAISDLLESSAELRDLITDAFPLIIVDEFQDTDNDQWRIIKSLLHKSTIFCLADPDQRIFDYRPDVDEHRIEHFRSTASPKVFDLGGENHRSPTAGILKFADAVLHNRGPLPDAKEVTCIRYRNDQLDQVIHAAVIWSFSRLRKLGVEHPTLAVLCRSNPFLAKLSIALSEEHLRDKTRLVPVEHDVVWDAELSAAAAAVVGAVLEWDADDQQVALARTLRTIAEFYLVKNAEQPSRTAVECARKFDEAAAAIMDGKEPRIVAARDLRSKMQRAVFKGEPVSDWRTARDLLNEVKAIADIVREVRLVRMFRATDAIGSGLSTLWIEKGSYKGAADLVKRILDREKLLSTERDPTGCILMSIHKSKGKEFDGVILIEGRYESSFFNERRETPPYIPSRRLLRVGMTRPRLLLTILQPYGTRDLVD